MGGQTGHRTPQCRNALGGGAEGGDGAGGSGAPLPELLPPEEASDGDDSLSLSSDSSDEERRRWGGGTREGLQRLRHGCTARTVAALHFGHGCARADACGVLQAQQLPLGCPMLPGG